MIIDEVLYQSIKRCLPIACVDLIVRCNGKVLLLCRDNQPARKQFWFPGGRIHVGEEIDDACKRKLYEETKLSAEFEKVLTVENTIFRDPAVHTVNVCCVMNSDHEYIPRLDCNHSSYIWSDLKTSEMLLPALDIAVLRPLRLALQ